MDQPETRAPRRSRLGVDLAMLALVGILLIGAVGAGISTLYTSYYGPSAFVTRYLELLSTGHAADALHVPGVAIDRATLEEAGITGTPSEAMLRSAALASLTDWVDGYLARSRGSITTFGKLMDPIADKLLVVAALVSLVSLDRLPAWVAMVIIARELAVTMSRMAATGQGLVISANRWGKAKTALQVLTIFLGLALLKYILGCDLLFLHMLRVTPFSECPAPGSDSGCCGSRSTRAHPGNAASGCQLPDRCHTAPDRPSAAPAIQSPSADNLCAADGWSSPGAS